MQARTRVRVQLGVEGKGKLEGKAGGRHSMKGLLIQARDLEKIQLLAAVILR